MIDIEPSVLKCVQEVLQAQKLEDPKLEITGRTGKGEGYLGCIIFLKVTGSLEGSPVKYNFVIKHGNSNETVRSNVPSSMAYAKETIMYNTVFPALLKFQAKKQLKKPFNNFPKCYKGFESEETLILDNLKCLSYEMNDFKVPMNGNHLKLTLKCYAKYHALSLALRDQEPEVFQRITADKISTFKSMADYNCIKWFETPIKYRSEELWQLGEHHLADKFSKVEVKKVLRECLDETDPQSVITHGDCWNNNVMFLYKDGNREEPIDCKLLDFQMAGVASPVVDLTYFFYANATPEEVDKFDDYMEVYIKELHSFLKELGSSPELFTEGDLKRHWKKYGVYGLLFAPIIYGLALSDDHVDIGEFLDEGNDIGEVFNRPIKDPEVFYKRLISLLKHFDERGFF